MPGRVSDDDLCISYYSDLAFQLPFKTRRQLAHAVAATLLEDCDFTPILSSVPSINLVFGELLSPMIRDQVDGNLYGPSSGGSQYEWQEIVAEQESIAKLLHKVVLDNSSGGASETFVLLQQVRRSLGDGGPVRIRFTIPPLAFECIRVATALDSERMSELESRLVERREAWKREKMLKEQEQAGKENEGDTENGEENESDPPVFELDDISCSPITQTLDTLYKFLHVTVATLLKAQESFLTRDTENSSAMLFGGSDVGANSRAGSPSSTFMRSEAYGTGLMPPPYMSLRLFLECGKSADSTRAEDMAYEFFVQVQYISLHASGLYYIRRIYWREQSPDPGLDLDHFHTGSIQYFWTRKL